MSILQDEHRFHLIPIDDQQIVSSRVILEDREWHILRFDGVSLHKGSPHLLVTMVENPDQDAYGLHKEMIRFVRPRNPDLYSSRQMIGHYLDTDGEVIAVYC